MSLETETLEVRQALRSSVSHLREQLSGRLESLEIEDWVEHQKDVDNPHQTHKAHVNLHALENYPLATDVEVVASESGELYVTVGQLSLIMTSTEFRDMGVIRPPTPAVSTVILENDEATVDLEATSFALMSEKQTGQTFKERRYRFTGPGANIEQTSLDQEPLTLDISLLGSGVYLWQCQDVGSDDSESEWSFPGWVILYRGSAP